MSMVVQLGKIQILKCNLIFCCFIFEAFFLQNPSIAFFSFPSSCCHSFKNLISTNCDLNKKLLPRNGFSWKFHSRMRATYYTIFIIILRKLFECQECWWESVLLGFFSLYTLQSMESYRKLFMFSNRYFCCTSLFLFLHRKKWEICKHKFIVWKSV